MIKIGPVNPDNFLGREKELQRLDKIKNDYLQGYRRNLGILGPLSIGKTSLILKYIHKGLKEDLFPLYVNLEEGFLKESFLGFLLFFLDKFSGRQDNIPFADVSNIEEVINQNYPLLNSSIRDIENSRKNADFTGLLGAIFKLPKKIRKILGKNCFFVLDEFFGLEKLRISAWKKILREHIMLDKYTLFVLLSSEIEKAKSVLNSELSLLFGNFEIMELKNFSEAESLKFVKERLAKIKSQEEVLNSLVLLSDGSPLYLDLLTNWIKENISVLNWNELILTLRENLLENKGFLYRYFYERLNSSPGMEKFQDFLPFIIEIARGSNRRRELKKKINFNAVYYNNFMDGFLDKSGSFYRIKDRLFKIWLLYAYRSDSMGLNFDSQQILNSLQNKIRNLNTSLSGLKLESQREKIKILIKNLLFKFQDEYIEVENGRKLLPRFSQVEEEVETAEYLILKGNKVRAGSWLIVVFESNVSEEDIYELLLKIKSDFTKCTQKIAISLSEMDQNLKSILKAKDFWFWDYNFLQNILEFYTDAGSLV